MGKTATALALANDLGASPIDTLIFPASDFGIDAVRRTFEMLRARRPMFGQWFVLVVEEMEFLVSREVVSKLKMLTSEGTFARDYSRLVVVATSNDSSKIDRYLLQRFEKLAFSNDATFAKAFRERLAWIWSMERPGEPPPAMARCCGWDRGAFSARTALGAIENYLRVNRPVAEPEAVGTAA